MIPIILSGGSGTRLWPISRKNYPKQFMDFFGKTLHTITLERLSPLGGEGYVITGEHLKNLTTQEINKGKFNFQVLIEPQAKNTAAAIAFLCRTFQLQNKADEVVGIFPADHYVSNSAKFVKLCQQAAERAAQGAVVLLGIKPTYAETGYGYIEYGAEAGDKVFHVKRFHEKPDAATAESFVAQPQFLWNGGMFIFKVSTMVALFEKLQPQMWAEFAKVKTPADFAAAFKAVPSTSIDYAIMEKAPESLLVIPADVGWSDVGSWDAVADLSRKFPVENNRRVIEVSSDGNYIQNQSEQLLALVGIEDCVVINTPDALMVAKKGTSQNVKDVVEILKRTEFAKATEAPSKEERPWGEFEVLRDTDQFKSKVIHVNAGAQISYQSHAKREEHWIVTMGAGEVVLNDEIIPVKRGTYVHIPLGAKHRIRNTGKERLQFVEVQIGSYFGEDDIVRYQDDYKRE